MAHGEVRNRISLDATTENAYFLLSEAIIVRACDDWCNSIDCLRFDPSNEDALKLKTQAEEFLLSEGFRFLAPYANGRYVLERLKRKKNYYETI